MLIAVTTFIVVMDARWQSVGGQLLASGVLLISGYQDIGLRARIGAAFWFFMALAFGMSALATTIWTKLWGGAAICAVVLCFETWLILRWWSRRTSP
jgi:hypothetical protein